MSSEDWLTAGFNVAIGLFLGLALNGLWQLVANGSWLLAAVALAMGVGAALALFLFEGLAARLTRWLFPGGVLPAPPAAGKARRPVLRLVSLPVGILVGVVLARFGLTETILGLV